VNTKLSLAEYIVWLIASGTPDEPEEFLKRLPNREDWQIYIRVAEDAIMHYNPEEEPDDANA
jgi:hypothetical protein